MNIRKFTEQDFPMLTSWWIEHSEVPPSLEMMPESSWIIEEDGNALASMCLIYTNLKAVCYCAHFISNAQANSDKRKQAVKTIFDFISGQAKELGYKRLLAFGYQPKLTERFKALGFTHTATNLNSFVKEL